MAVNNDHFLKHHAAVYMCDVNVMRSLWNGTWVLKYLNELRRIKVSCFCILLSVYCCIVTAQILLGELCLFANIRWQVVLVGGALIRDQHRHVSLTMVKFCNMSVPLFILACLFLQGSALSKEEAVVRWFHIIIQYHSELCYCLLNPEVHINTI